MRKNFTLIELLIVIAIIAILAAILLPSLGRARDKARASDCTSRLKQIGAANVMYMDDFNGCYPVSGTALLPDGTTSYAWGKVLGGHGYLGKDYLRIARCPSIPRSPKVIESNDVSTYAVNTDYRTGFYTVAASWSGSSSIYKGFGVLRLVRSPSNYVTHIDSISVKASTNYTAYAYYQFGYKASMEGAPFMVHSNFADALMGDGHVAAAGLNDAARYILTYAVNQNLNVYDITNSTLVSTLTR